MRFKPEKAVEAMLFIASRHQSLTRHTLAKLFYFADKLHLQRYGRLISGDRYIAMKHGPVPSRIYNIVKSPDAYDASRGVLLCEPHPFVSAQREPNMDFLSKSEVECLEEALKKYGHLSFEELTRLSHDSAWHKADPNDEMSIEDIALTVEDSDSLLAYLQDPCPEEEQCVARAASS